jgi:hypothetical protein
MSGRIAIESLVLACLVASGLVGCGSAGGNFLLGAGLVTGFGAEAPSQELEQVYYLGIFDPQEQVPEAVYRLTVRGQASVYSGMRFSSGWVPAKFVDSLSTQIGSSDDPTTRPIIDKGDAELLANLKPGRRMMLFGPEGFRESPGDQRLVIVMGASPEAFFKAIDLSLGALAQAQAQRLPAQMAQNVGAAMLKAKAQQDALNALKFEVNSYEWTEPKL